MKYRIGELRLKHSACWKVSREGERDTYFDTFGEAMEYVSKAVQRRFMNDFDAFEVEIIASIPADREVMGML